MVERVARKFDFRRRLLLSVARVLIVAVPGAFGLLHPTQSWAQSSAKNAAQDMPEPGREHFTPRRTCGRS